MTCKITIYAFVTSCCTLLAACGGGGAGSPETGAAQSFSTDPNPTVIEAPTGVKVTTSSIPERTGDYRGEANRTWAVLEQAGVKAVAFVTETEFSVPAEKRGPPAAINYAQSWGIEYLNALGIPREQYVDKTYIARQNRRFLYYKPKREAETGKYPLMIILHGYNVSPEFERHANTLGRPDELAERDGFVVVYANGQQAKGETKSDAFYTNLGTWSSCDPNDPDYFNQIIPELTARGIPIDEDRVYMAGTSAGASAALSAATTLGGKIAGVAAVTPSYYWPAGYKVVYQTDKGPEEHAFDSCGIYTQPPFSVIAIQSLQDPAFADSGTSVTTTRYNTWSADIRRAWRQALNIPETITETVAIPNTVQEGNGFVGTLTPQVRATRNSQATIYRYPPAPSGATFEYVEMDHAGHGWPTPRAIDDWHGNVETFGLRNQDFDASELIWAFMKDKRRIR
ncbi:MAG: hypothetical protein IPL70_09760 [Uliginosibacterium sp.]|nr:hypothetical protein [Uliginosibacterium sp.]